MIGKSHYRVRGVNCGKCDRIHAWYKYRVWREGDKVKEEYIGKCDAWGNMEFDHSRYTHHRTTNQHRYQQPPNDPSYQRERTPYEILGVPYNATREQIKKAYHDLVKKHHPDANKNADHRTIAEINVAYNILMKQ